MSSARNMMIGSGGVLVALALIGAAARLLDAGQAIPSLQTIPSPALYVTAGSMALIGLLLIGFAPPSRRDERRVRLDARTAVQHQILRPSTKEGIPRTSGMSRSAETANGSQASQPAYETSTRPEAGTVVTAPPMPAASAPAPAPPKAAPVSQPRAAAHPNDPIHEAQPPAAPSPAARAAVPHADGNGRGERRAELLERLELLDLKANNAKVRYGLGKISAAGYRQYLKEVDQERTLIEAELMESADAE